MTNGDTLIDDVWKILEQKHITLDDLDKLSILDLKLWYLAWKYWEMAAEEAYKYNKELKLWIRKQLQMWVPYNKADANVGADIEPKYGEYRIHKAKGETYDSFCKRLDNHIKFLMNKNKINIMAEDASKRL